MQRLFVYGSLAPGRSNFHELAEVDGHWERACIDGFLYQEGWGNDVGYPGVVPSEDGPEVEGYLFSSTELAEHWPRLDEFEGEEYQRILVQVRSVESGTVEAFVYAINRTP